MVCAHFPCHIKTSPKILTPRSRNSIVNNWPNILKTTTHQLYKFHDKETLYFVDENLIFRYQWLGYVYGAVKYIEFLSNKNHNYLILSCMLIYFTYNKLDDALTFSLLQQAIVPLIPIGTSSAILIRHMTIRFFVLFLT